MGWPGPIQGSPGHASSTLYIYFCKLKLYEKVEGAVVGQEGLSEWYVLGRGVRQRGVLSPLLYSLYVNGIIEELRGSGLGVVVTGSTGESIWVGCWLYADDVVLMAKDEVEMQKMLRVVEGFAKKWRFRLSVAKSKVVKFVFWVN